MSSYYDTADPTNTNCEPSCIPCGDGDDVCQEPAGQTETADQRAARAVGGCISGCGSSGSTSCETGVNLSPGSGDFKTALRFPGFSGTGIKAALKIVYNSIDAGLTSVLGRGWTLSTLSKLTEDPQGNISIVENGFTARFAKSGSSYNTGTGLRRNLVKNGDGTFTETLRYNGNQRKYDANGNLLSISDAAGVAQYFEYSGNDLEKILLASNRTVYFEYDSGKMFRIVDFADRETYFTYNGDDLEKIDAPGCCTQEFTYDGNGLMLSQTDAEGYATEIAYDLDRIEKLSRGGETTYFEYIGDDDTKVTDSRGNRWDYIHNADDVLDQGDTPLGASVQKQIGPNFEKTAQQDPVGNTTYFQYDDQLNQTVQIDPLGNQTYFGYDTNNDQVQQTDALDQTTYFEYDSGRLMTKQIDALGRMTEYGYDTATSNRTLEVDALDQATYFGYDSEGRMDRQVDRRGNVTYYGYDAADNQTRVQNALEDTSYFEYDGADLMTKQIDELGRQTQFSYDGRGLQVQRTDALNGSSYFEYDAFAQMVEQTDELGRRTYFAYDGEGNQTEMSQQLGGSYLTTYYEFDASNRQTHMIDPRGTGSETVYDAADRTTKTVADSGGLNLTTYFEYDANSNQTKVIDPRGNATLSRYDELNRVDATEDALGNTTYFGFDEVGNTVRQQDARGNTTYFGYDDLNRQTAMADRLWLNDPGPVHTTYFEYDAQGNQTAVIDQNSNATLSRYDALNRQDATQDAAGFATYFGFDEVGNTVRQQDARGNATYFGYDDLNRQVRSQDADLDVTYFEYDAVGNQTQVIDPRGNATLSGYDDLNRLARTEDALNNVTYFGYDPDSNQTSIEDARGNTTHFGYDALNRQTQVEDADGFTTYFGYDANSNQTRVQDARLNTTYFNYDALNRLTATDDSIGNVNESDYDPNGNVTQSSVGGGIQFTYFTYDADDRLTEVEDGEGGQTYFVYDGVGKTTEVVDANGHQTYFHYDSRNLLSSTEAPDGSVVYFGYDGNANTTHQVDPLGHTTYYVYDAVNRLTTITDPLGEPLQFDYDANSNLSKQVNSEGSTSYFSYDALNRLTGITYDTEGSDVSTGLGNPTYDYDEVGNLTQMTDQWGQHDMAYDARNLVTKHQFPNSDVVYFEYDGNANRTGLVYPGTSGQLDSSFDARNRQTQLTSPSGGTAYFSYNGADQPTQRLYANDVAQDASYDRAGRNESWVNNDANGDPLTYFQYTRDPKGLPTKCVRDTDHTIYYTYDDNDRLTDEVWTTTDPSPTIIYGYQYAYDTVGNRIRARRNGVDTYYHYDDANALTVKGDDGDFANPTYFEYDRNGSMIKEHDTTWDRTTYFDYNAAGMIDRVTWKDESYTQFHYDGNLQRYAMTQGAPPSAPPNSDVTTYFLWDGPNILQEQAADGTVTAEYSNAQTPIAGIGQLVQTHRPQEASADQNIYPVMDQRGTIHKWVKDDGVTVIAEREYDAFGNIIPNSELGTWPSNFGYQGQTWYEIQSYDKQQTLLQSPARIYDPELGIFASRDPKGFVDGMSLYEYATNGPVGIVDPNGTVTSVLSNSSSAEAALDGGSSSPTPLVDPKKQKSKDIKLSMFTSNPKGKADAKLERLLRGISRGGKACGDTIVGKIKDEWAGHLSTVRKELLKVKYPPLPKKGPKRTALLKRLKLSTNLYINALIELRTEYVECLVRNKCLKPRAEMLATELFKAALSHDPAQKIQQDALVDELIGGDKPKGDNPFDKPGPDTNPFK